tara:strand:- start:808 stop:1014 length:207 start_codon:yes stop_codon:yes gene_type:complete
MIQKIVNVLAIASTVVSASVVGGGVYVYLNRASIIESAKEKVMEAVMPDIGGSVGDALPDVTGPALPF